MASVEALPVPARPGNRSCTSRTSPVASQPTNSASVGIKVPGHVQVTERLTSGAKEAAETKARQLSKCAPGRVYVAAARAIIASLNLAYAG